MTKIAISPELKELSRFLRLACISTDVVVNDLSERLQSEIKIEMGRIRERFVFEEIIKMPAIAATRKAYKDCGKDPARYRPSAEALLRRILSGKELYQINNVVDQLNLVSIATGFSIGGYDANQIQGDITFGIGRPNEPYFGIGRGELNIENLPVFRDDLGAFGTPTSDSKRTEVTKKTSRFLMVLIDFGSDNYLDTATQMAIGLLKEYAQATNINEYRIE
jgi:DNA/RNA-binding domain of Phe-tRNA-synthetase-like protein